jgi:phosphoribosylglycinamide formyltransferase-1
MDAHSEWYYRLGVRMFMLLFGYQVILLSYGFLLGQWAFFWKYELKLLRKLKILPQAPLKTPIAIFASGAGSNALKIMQFFEQHPTISVDLLICNKPGAGVIHHAEKQGVPVLLIEKDRFFRGDAYIPVLQQHRISFIVLAGFLWKIPASLIAVYPNKMLNIHPALLPKFGGKGMYGENVHRAVLDSGEKESGISIHLVNEHFDEGKVIFQSSCPIEPNETPHSLAQKVHQLEHANYPRVIETFVIENSQPATN